ncbi:hypothetical protein U1Q18_023032 [Sarracenia purpurea var. burkii]
MANGPAPSDADENDQEGDEEFFLKPLRPDVNKLKPLLMKTKQEYHQTPGTGTQETQELPEKPEAQLPPPPSPAALQELHLQQQSSNKRKALEEVLSPERTRLRYSCLTVV